MVIKHTLKNLVLQKIRRNNIKIDKDVFPDGHIIDVEYRGENI